MSDSLQPHELQHSWLPRSSLSPRVCSNSCSLSRWCHPTISFCVTPFSCLQYFPGSGSFPMNHLWIWYKIDLSVSFYHVDKIKLDINGMNTLCNFWYSKWNGERQSFIIRATVVIKNVGLKILIVVHWWEYIDLIPIAIMGTIDAVACVMKYLVDTDVYQDGRRVGSGKVHLLQVKWFTENSYWTPTEDLRLLKRQENLHITE